MILINIFSSLNHTKRLAHEEEVEVVERAAAANSIAMMVNSQLVAKQPMNEPLLVKH